MTPIAIPIRTVSESNQRGHWTSHHKRHQHHRGIAKLLTTVAVAGERRLPVCITMRRIAPRRLDTGNLAVSMKAAQDGVCDALRISDGAVGIEWRYEQRRSEIGEGYAVEVEIEWAILC